MMDEKAYREKCGKINSRYNLLGSSVMDITAEQHGIYKWFKFTYILLFNTFSQKQRKKMILSTAVKNGLKNGRFLPFAVLILLLISIQLNILRTLIQIYAMHICISTFFFALPYITHILFERIEYVMSLH